jgi:magnesium chelatase subunit D
VIDNSRDKSSSARGGEHPDFSDIVGQAELKRALLAVGANPALDGLLVRGEKGTAKSTAVRALADCLPAQRVVAGCPYGCPPDDPARQCPDCRERVDPDIAERPTPLVTAPLGATRERVVGSLSVADALDGDHSFDPGLLARANRGILYVDEVNLLDDHLVDVLLDAAASGVNRVERDGVSVTHPAEFTLVGTMNPEEGDLRPQLRDRFALQATVAACEDVADRVAILEEALGRETGGKREQSRGDPAPADRLADARARLDDVTIPDEFLRETAELCRDAGVEGHRADIATARAARTLAALDGRTTVIESDVRRAAALALPHRMRSRPFEDAPDAGDVVDDHFREEEPNDGGEADDTDESDGVERSDDRSAGETDDGSAGDGADDESASDPSNGDGRTHPGAGDEPASAVASGGVEERADDEGGDDRTDDPADATPLVPGERRAAAGEARAPALDVDAEGDDGESGRATAAPSTEGRGPRVRTERATDGADVDAAASVRAAAGRGGGAVRSRDLRRSVRAAEASTLVVFAVDASASMRPAMRAAKGTVLALLEDSYRQRDRVGFVAFAGDGAEVILPPTDSVQRAARHLKDLPTGDRTPLPAGLRTAGDVVERADPAASVVVLVTDGRANVAEGNVVSSTRRAADRLESLGTRVVVVDAGEGDGLAHDVAARTDGRRIPLSDLSADAIDAAAGAADES